MMGWYWLTWGLGDLGTWGIIARHALLNHPVTMQRQRFIRKIGNLSNTKMQEITLAIATLIEYSN